MSSTATPTRIATPARVAAHVPDGIRVRTEALRSANVEHDTGADSVRRYVLTGRGQRLLASVGRALTDPAFNRAWSVTGPYGTGKSSFGVLLAALLCPSLDNARRRGNDSRAAALELLGQHDAQLADIFGKAGKGSGFIRATATARREPIGATVARAIINGATRAWPDEAPVDLRPALQVLADRISTRALGGAFDDTGEMAGGSVSSQTAPSAKVVLDALATCLRERPVLLMIDEFGKSLEHFAAYPDTDTSGDLFLMQELAELAAGSRGAGRNPLFLITFQHSSFADYADRAAALQRREWSKIQGRFLDVSFADDPGDVATLLAGSLDHSAIDAAAEKALLRYGEHATRTWKSRGLASVLAPAVQTMSRTYPVHPLAVASLAALCATLGQHDRTLTGMLTADEPHTVARFLREAASDTQQATGRRKSVLATYKLADVFDYFASSVRSPALFSSQGSRWLEIETRISAARDLPSDQIAALKAVALLNIADTGGALRASADNVAFALSEPEAHDTAARARCAATLNELVEANFLTYREHADEYRLWAGTDIDIKARVQAAREQLVRSDIGELLSRSYVPAAVVAGKHSQTTGMLRHFATVVNDAGQQVSAAEFPGTADGTIVLHLGTRDDMPVVVSLLPVLIGVTADASDIRSVAADVLALGEVLGAEDLDPVARAEIRERTAIARARLTTLLARAYNPSRDDVAWTLQINGEPDSEVHGQRSLSALVSLACDRAYSSSPEIRNEMLGRHQLTSQGAKARRELIEALLTHPGEKTVGLDGYGPDVAMYHGVVEWLGLHGSLDGDDTQGWKVPLSGSSAHAAYEQIGRMVRDSTTERVTIADIGRRLAAPPYGVKAGVYPLLLVAALAYSEDDIAVFEDGSFVARLTPDFVERIIKTPDRATLRYAPPGPGQRAAVITELGTRLGIDPAQRHRRGPRNPSLVRVAAALLDQIRSASTYTLATFSLSVRATTVRRILRTAQNPDELVFELLPAAVGEDPVPPGTPEDKRTLRRYVTKLVDALTEIETCDERLATELGDWCASQFSCAGGLQGTREKLLEYASGIQTAVAEPLTRSLLAHSKVTSLSDEDWLAQLALIVTDDPMASWRDEHPQRFRLRFAEAAAAIARLYALHFNAEGRNDSIESRRLTLTRSDGREEHLVVAVPSGELADTLNAAAEGLLGSAETDYGPGGRQLLVAALVTRLLENANDSVALHAAAPHRTERTQGATA